MEYTFDFACSYMGRAEYRVWRGRVLLGVLMFRSDVSDYERSIYNGDPTEIEAEIGLAWWMHRSGEPMPAEVVDAFNAWRMAQFEAARAKYGEEFTPERDRPAPLRPGVWTREIGFHQIAA
jgi:hypothetical protein